MMSQPLRLLIFSLLALHSIQAREIINFNNDWEFAQEDSPQKLESIDSLNWREINVPHDWSIEMPYSQKDTAASTGFHQGGIGWYRKSFSIQADEIPEKAWIEFDGIYNHSTCWINGHRLGYRPNGYISFGYDLTNYLKEENTIVVRVDRSQYIDSRWYTGAGIYRDVRLVRTSETHIPQWGVRIETPQVYPTQASVNIRTSISTMSSVDESVQLEIQIVDPRGKTVSKTTQNILLKKTGNKKVNTRIFVKNPMLWNLENPRLYTAKIRVQKGINLLDEVVENFGIRSIQFESDKGFSLNGKYIKLKGVNLHHDAGAVGAAVPRDIWFSRVKKLKDMGCNAIRTAHNPHAPDLMDVCDELGMLVLAEAFDEWNVPKDKSLAYLGDNAAPTEFSKAYPAHFDEWAERDLKSLISRDYNHPSIIMWSIGNEIEWTFRYYQKSSSYAIGDLDDQYYFCPPDFDPEKILRRLDDLLEGNEDQLLNIAAKLSRWVKEEDTTRWVTCGSVHPSVGLASGYADVVDIIGFNYRAVEYEGAHEMYPDKKIYGSENWVTRNEWNAVKDKDYVGGIFIWTGFAYKGEAGPYPRKGLNISLFDYTGTQTPRGHMFETMWKDEPKVYMTTYPLEQSEYSYDNDDGWTWKKREYEIPAMSWLRLWEWDNFNEHWNYTTKELILIQAYTNCEEAELFLNDKSLGVKALTEFDDGCLKWIVPFQKGELKIVGMKGGKPVNEYLMQTAGKPTQIHLKSDRKAIRQNGKDVVQVFVQLSDQNGIPVRHSELNVEFETTDNLRLRAIDNGSEFYVGSHQANQISTYNGRAYAIFECTAEKTSQTAEALIKANIEGAEPTSISLKIKNLQSQQ